MKFQHLQPVACVIAALTSYASAQEWEVFFESGFETLPLGPFHEFEHLLPHMLVGGGTGSPTQYPWVVSAPEPTSGAQSIRLEAWDRSPGIGTSSVAYYHVRERFGERSFSFPGAAGHHGGYRALRVTFDMYHASDPDPGWVRWPGGGINPFADPPTAQIVKDVTAPVEAVYDEWIHISLTFDFEHELMSGSYADQVSTPVSLPTGLREQASWGLSVTAWWLGDPPGSFPDVETVWLDNLVVEVIPPCPADCDLDYAHTFFDFLCFQNLFARGDDRADCDLDGELTFLDFLCFQNYFASDCI